MLSICDMCCVACVVGVLFCCCLLSTESEKEEEEKEKKKKQKVRETMFCLMLLSNLPPPYVDSLCPCFGECSQVPWVVYAHGWMLSCVDEWIGLGPSPVFNHVLPTPIPLQRSTTKTNQKNTSQPTQASKDCKWADVKHTIIPDSCCGSFRNLYAGGIYPFSVLWSGNCR